MHSHTYTYTNSHIQRFIYIDNYTPIHTFKGPDINFAHILARICCYIIAHKYKVTRTQAQVKHIHTITYVTLHTTYFMTYTACNIRFTHAYTIPHTYHTQHLAGYHANHTCHTAHTHTHVYLECQGQKSIHTVTNMK